MNGRAWHIHAGADGCLCHGRHCGNVSMVNGWINREVQMLQRENKIIALVSTLTNSANSAWRRNVALAHSVATISM